MSRAASAARLLSVDPKDGHIVWTTRSDLLTFDPDAGPSRVDRVISAGGFRSTGHCTGEHRTVTFDSSTGAQLTSAVSSPHPAGLTIGHTLYTATDAVGAQGSVQAVEQPDGRVRWTTAVDSDRPIVRTDGSFVVVASRPFQLNYGSLTRQLGDDPRGVAAKGDLANREQANAGFIRFQVLDARDGRELWRMGGDAQYAWPQGTSATAAPAVAAGRVYLQNTAGDLVALNARTGDVAWKQKASLRPVGAGGDIVIAQRGGSLVALGSTGRQRWTSHVPNASTVTVTPSGDAIYVTINGEEGGAPCGGD